LKEENADGIIANKDLKKKKTTLIHVHYGNKEQIRTLKKKEKITMSDIKFEIKKEIGTLSESTRGWTKELNLISWNGAAPKYDLRDWAPDHEKMGKGITLNMEEIRKLNQLLSKIIEKEENLSFE